MADVPLVGPIGNEVIRELLRLRRKVDIVAVVEGRTDRLLLESLMEAIGPDLLVFYVPATGRDAIAAVVSMMRSLQDIVSKKETRVKLIMRDCDDMEPLKAARAVFDALRAREREIELVSEGDRSISARIGIHHVVILAVGMYNDRRLSSLGVRRFAAEDYPLACLLRDPSLLEREVELPRGETSKEVLMALAGRLGQEPEELMEEIVARARDKGLLDEVIRPLADELRRALEAAGKRLTRGAA